MHRTYAPEPWYVILGKNAVLVKINITAVTNPEISGTDAVGFTFRSIGIINT